jgi:hypothetical protein
VHEPGAGGGVDPRGFELRELVDVRAAPRVRNLIRRGVKQHPPSVEYGTELRLDGGERCLELDAGERDRGAHDQRELVTVPGSRGQSAVDLLEDEHDPGAVVDHVEELGRGCTRGERGHHVDLAADHGRRLGVLGRRRGLDEDPAPVLQLGARGEPRSVATSLADRRDHRAPACRGDRGAHGLRHLRPLQPMAHRTRSVARRRARTSRCR